MSHVDVTDENFEQEVLAGDKPVLVDFWAPWCMPCQMLAPVIHDLAEEYADKAKICKVNVDEARESSTKYSIMSIPAVFIFKGGKVVEQLIGLRPKEDYIEALNRAI